MKKLFILALAISAAVGFAAEAIPLKKEMFSSKSGEISTFMEEDGLSSIVLKTVTNSNATGNKYMDCFVSLPEALDLTGKGLALTVKTDTPDVLRGFYFRAYNVGEKEPALSFLSWKSPIRSEYQRIVLYPESNSTLDWEKAKVTGTAPNNINRFSFHIGTPMPSAEMNVKIKAIEIVDNPHAKVGNAISGFDYIGLARSSFSRAAEIVAADSDGNVVIGAYSVAPVDHPQFNRYDALAFAVQPIDLTGKTVKFDLRGTDNITGVYVRFFKDKAKKSSLSFVRSGAPASEWTACELKGGESGSFNWQGTEVDGGDFSGITRIEFIFSCPKGGETFGIEVRNLTVE